MKKIYLEEDDKNLKLRNFKVAKIIKSDSKVLDIGCGLGFMHGLLNKKNCDYYGIDWEDYKRVPKERFKKIDLNQKRKIPFKDNSFDYVLCLDVLEHLFYPIEIINEIKRVTKKKGLL